MEVLAYGSARGEAGEEVSGGSFSFRGTSEPDHKKPKKVAWYVGERKKVLRRMSTLGIKEDAGQRITIDSKKGRFRRGWWRPGQERRVAANEG